VAVTSQCEERGFRRSAETNFEIAIAVVPAGTKCEKRGFRRSAGTNFEIAIAVVPAGTTWRTSKSSTLRYSPSRDVPDRRQAISRARDYGAPKRHVVVFRQGYMRVGKIALIKHQRSPI
jgi:hypothetical protein